MIIDVWRPVYKLKNKIMYELDYISSITELKRKGYIVRYICDRCKSDRVHTTTSSTFFRDFVVFNTIDYQTCRSCRSKISEYEIKKTQIPYSDVLKSITNSFYRLITTEVEYKLADNKSQLKLNVFCDNKHSYYTTWNNWKKGKRCRECYEFSRRENAVRHKYGFTLYKHLITSESNKNYNIHKDIINPNNVKRSIYDYHLDHIYSIYDGFNNNVPVYLMSSIFNLRLIKSSKNLSKNKKSDITLDELFESYNRNL